MSMQRSSVVRGFIYFLIGIFSFPGLELFNKLRVKGMERLTTLPRQNVLFVSNHQTYYADVIALIHIFCAVHAGKTKGLGIPIYLLWPFTRIRYVAAETTMKSNWLSKLFTLGGAITVKRTWQSKVPEERKSLNPGDTRNITRALEENWVITFPQGTTTPYAPGRKGTAFIIKQTKPIVIPVLIDGFSRAFDKKGLKLRKKGTKLSITFKDPLQINYEDSMDNILAQVMDAIEQSNKFAPQKITAS